MEPVSPAVEAQSLNHWTAREVPGVCLYTMQNGYLRMVYAGYHYKIRGRASLVAQWLRICLPMQGTRVRALVREDPTCRGATKPLHHNY